MDDLVIASLCLLCWINGVWFGWLRWSLPQLLANGITGEKK